MIFIRLLGLAICIECTDVKRCLTGACGAEYMTGCRKDVNNLLYCSLPG